MKNKFPKYSTGNVLKTKYGSIIIITKVGTGVQYPEDDYYSWISFDSTNVSGGSYFKTREKVVSCEDQCGHRCEDEDCECKGTGKYPRTDYGLDKATLLGSTVKDYIMNSLLKNFDF